MPETADIAVVSFDKFIHGNDDDRRAVAKQLYDAFSSVGWVYLRDHGIAQERVDEMFTLVRPPYSVQMTSIDHNQAKTFFDQPLQEKLRWRLQDAELNQGYTADGDEANGGVDHKECYEHRRFANPCCPADTDLPGFRKRVDEFYAECLSLGINVLKCLAMAMDLGDNFFDDITKKADPQLRLLHYPAIEKRIVEQKGHARIIPHTDFGLCTLLFQDSVGGLEVDPFHTGDFKPALPVPGTVLINIADLMQRLTNDRCRSTMHRVVSPKVSSDILPSRFSMPFFIHPDPEAMIDPITKSKDEVKKYEPVNAGEWRTYNTRKNYTSLPTAAA
jgi:isopenicillin N synthase-like dioxygenase